MGRWLKAKVALLLVAVVALGAVAIRAEVGGNNSISVTSTATTTTLANVATTVCFISASASANKYFARLFVTGETPAAATSSSPIYVDAGKSVCLTHNPRTESGSGYIGYSVITAAAETATARVISK